MSNRKGWDNLSQSQRDRYTRTLGQGSARTAERLYNNPRVSLGRARGHGSGAAAPAPKYKPTPEAQHRIAELRALTDRPRRELRTAANVYVNTGHGGGGKIRKNRPDLAEIKRVVARLTDEELEGVAGMSAGVQRDWFRGAIHGPFDAAQLYYHGMEGWNA